MKIEYVGKNIKEEIAEAFNARIKVKLDECDRTLDTYEYISDSAKEVGDLVSIDYEQVRKILREAYESGFTDGYKTASGVEKDEYGGWEY